MSCDCSKTEKTGSAVEIQLTARQSVSDNIVAASRDAPHEPSSNECVPLKPKPAVVASNNGKACVTHGLLRTLPKPTFNVEPPPSDVTDDAVDSDCKRRKLSSISTRSALAHSARTGDDASVRENGASEHTLPSHQPNTSSAPIPRYASFI